MNLNEIEPPAADAPADAGGVAAGGTELRRRRHRKAPSGLASRDAPRWCSRRWRG